MFAEAPAATTDTVDEGFEAVEIASDTRMGLSGSVHLTDLDHTQRIETGTIHVDDLLRPL